ncbi:MAG: IS30 family transposase, partial [Gammaproteobacteria bacterium]
MEQRYSQLSLDERIELARLQAEGSSIRQIAAGLDRAPSTISRELKRNRAATKPYKPVLAQERTAARRWKGSRLERHPPLRQKVLAGLGAGLSPEQVAGRLALESGQTVISHESIYRFIYAQITRTNDFSWRRFLPRAKYKRGRRRRPGGSPATFIHGRTSIEQRPAAANDRHHPGHWEADLMLFANYGQAVLTLHDRHSRILLARRPPSKASRPIIAALHRMLKPLPQPLRQTLTFDNGTEFAKHLKLRQLGIATYFCDPHAPWQKGGIENAIGRLRRRLPRKTDLATLSKQHFLALIRNYNNTPRKC